MAHVFEMRCFRRLLNISLKDHATNNNARRKIQAAIGWEVRRTLDLGQETETKIVWSYLKVFRLIKDDSAGHSKTKKKKKLTEEQVQDNIKE